MSRNWTGPCQVAFFFLHCRRIMLAGSIHSTNFARNMYPVLLPPVWWFSSPTSFLFRVLQVDPSWQSPTPTSFHLVDVPSIAISFYGCLDSFLRFLKTKNLLSPLYWKHFLGAWASSISRIAYLHTLFYRPRNQRPSIRLLTNLYNLGILWVGDFYKHCRFFLALD